MARVATIYALQMTQCNNFIFNRTYRRLGDDENHTNDSRGESFRGVTSTVIPQVRLWPLGGDAKQPLSLTPFATGWSWIPLLDLVNREFHR